MTSATNLAPRRIAESETIMTELVLPNDTNALHDLMGGILMKWMDVAGAICAGRHCQQPVVTISVDYVSFQKPIHLGDVVTLKAVVTRAFNTSVEIFVEVFAGDIRGGGMRKCNDAYLTFVGVDLATRKPVPVPPVLPLTGDEQQRYQAALRRREMRLILSGRMKPEEATELRSIFTGS